MLPQLHRMRTSRPSPEATLCRDCAGKARQQAAQQPCPNGGHPGYWPAIGPVRKAAGGVLYGRYRIGGVRRREWWSNAHGRWAYQLELSPHADGRRRNPLRRRGFATLEEVEAELGHARALPALDEDPHIQREVTDLMLSVLQDSKALPPVEEVRGKARTRQDLNPTVTVAEWMAEFLLRSGRSMLCHPVPG
ncbi:hypothetical protein [Nonomuraea jabiensis]|uniref:hypothetical protein n=1 Tax=Nonomuraea jabiensis TaxID=882448 RepID=UPI003D7176A5